MLQMQMTQMQDQKTQMQKCLQLPDTSQAFLDQQTNFVKLATAASQAS
jgi:hypothetical protein